MKVKIETQRIKDLRKLQGLSQRDLAISMNVSPQHISNLENKGTTISVNEKTIHSLTNSLNCTNDYLMGYSSDPGKTKDGKLRPITIETNLENTLKNHITRMPKHKMLALAHFAKCLEKCNSSQLQTLETICIAICKNSSIPNDKHLSEKDKLAIKIKESLLDFICDEIYIYTLPPETKHKNLTTAKRKEELKKYDYYCMSITNDFKEFLETQIEQTFLK